MWDTICHLPVPSDVISLAIHPTESIFAIGLASGHVRAIRLPEPHATTTPPTPSTNGTSGTASDAQQPRRSSLTRTSASASPTTGYGTLDTLWHTRRHKGSARALAFSPDGSTLFSAGTDRLLKAAHATSGRVLGKAALPADPSALCALNADTLLLGDDAGALHLYALSRVTRDVDRVNLTALVPRPDPTSTTHPHATDDDPAADNEPVTSITPLPPSSASTSGVARAWVTTAGDTLAAQDLHKGLVQLSASQGGPGAEELLASACVPSATAESATVLAADSAGLVSSWARGRWADRSSGVRARPPPLQTPGIAALRADADGDVDGGVECLAVSPTAHADGPLIAAGLASGAVRFLRVVQPRKAGGGAVQKGPRATLQPDAVQHDERGLDGVVGVGFDCAGRLISAGGALVKVWMWAQARAGGVKRGLGGGSGSESDDELRESIGDELRESIGDELRESIGDDLRESIGDEDDDEPRRRRKKRRRRETTRAGKPKRGAKGGAGHGIGVVAGLD